MIAYHIDRTRLLKSGDILELTKSIDQLSENSLPLVGGMFPEGLSKHGIQYCNDTIACEHLLQCSHEFLSTRSLPIPVIADINTNLSMWITEYSFELIRRVCFPSRPSRMQSFFALQSLDDLKTWPEITCLPYNIVQFDVDPSQVFEADASLLKSGFSTPHTGNFSCSFGFSPGMNYSFAQKYWSGTASEYPQKELLVKLPVTVISVTPVLTK